jgi:hypothetical protein
MKRILTPIADNLFPCSTFPLLVFWVLLLVLLNTSGSHVAETTSRYRNTLRLLSHDYKQPSNSSHDLDVLRSFHVENTTPRFIVIGAQVS